MKILVSLSGGLDSTTLMAFLLWRQHDVQAVSFKYPSKHNELELESAQAICKHYGVTHTIVDATSVFESFKSSLLVTGGPIPEGHYEAANMVSTVVPCRNLIFGSIIAGLASSLMVDYIALGVHSGDHAIYPDCRPDFVEAFDSCVQYATDGTQHVVTPFVQINKIDIAELAMFLEVPIDMTRTCYTDNEIPCGKCGACVERAEALSLAKMSLATPGKVSKLIRYLSTRI